MTEIVIRFDPQRALQTMVCGARRRIELGARYVERTWRSFNDKPVVTRLVYADRRTHIKIGMAAVGAASLLVIYGAATAITATPAKKSPLAQRFDDAVADTAKANTLTKGDSERVFRKVDMSKLAALETETRLVRTERIVPHEPPTMAIATAAPLPVSETVEEEVQPRPRAKRHVAVTHHAAVRGGDICTRHKLRKIVTRGGKSWRCGR